MPTRLSTPLLVGITELRDADCAVNEMPTGFPWLGMFRFAVPEQLPEKLAGVAAPCGYLG